MNVNEVRQMTDEEIQNAIEDSKEGLLNLRFRWEQGTLEDYTQIRVLKKDVARLYTILRERELAAAVVEGEKDNAE
jgi:large subunit ribosomal protein L29